MLLGKTAIILALIATIVSMLFYYIQSAKAKTSRKGGTDSANRQLGRTAYYIMSAFVVLATGYLFYLFVSHQFQVRYVYQYSSSDLQFGLLISALWAGQQGSFLLWAMFNALLGIILLKKAGKFEDHAMFFLNIIQLFFLVILVKASPFELMSQTPPDGAGLNPLLQNFWMIIHPPILFIGYAAIAFPLVLGLASLIQKDYTSWVDKAMPWTIFSSLTLGAGIIIGAFWSYETLGWGGYWGWDPVENSSLIPWLTIIALFHGLLLQKRNNVLVRSNYLLAMISYVLVLYATFLTRSGVLADFSVHSFQDLGINALLIVFLIIFLGSGLLIYFSRIRELPYKSIDFSKPTRENAIAVSILVLLASTVLVLLGTSSPLISGIFGEASQVDVSFYNKVNLPIAILITFLLGVTPFLLWTEEDFASVPKRMLLSAALATGITIIIVFFGLTEPVRIIFFLMSAFALCSNLIVFFRHLKVGWLNTGAPLAHFGVAIMFIGIIGSGHFSASQRLVLIQDQPETVLGNNLTYRGIQRNPDGKNIARIDVSGDMGNYTALPRLYESRNSEGVMREPDIKAGILTDFYISPLETRSGHDHAGGDNLFLIKGETDTYQDYKITFRNFEMTSHGDGSSAHMLVAAIIDVEFEGRKYELKPALVIGPQGRQVKAVALPFKQDVQDSSLVPKVALAGLNADNKSIELQFSGVAGNQKEQKEELIVEVSRKPFMSILWTGTLIMIAGTVIALRRRTVGSVS
jgi:cytochrome c-type biogenesis protein CcmF